MTISIPKVRLMLVLAVLTSLAPSALSSQEAESPGSRPEDAVFAFFGRVGDAPPTIGGFSSGTRWITHVLGEGRIPVEFGARLFTPQPDISIHVTGGIAVDALVHAGSGTSLYVIGRAGPTYPWGATGEVGLGVATRTLLGRTWGLEYSSGWRTHDSSVRIVAIDFFLQL